MLNKPAIIADLSEAHNLLWQTAQSLPDDKQERTITGKWSAAQHVQHINTGIRPLVKYLMLPKPYIAETYGQPEQPTRSYDELFTTYSNRIKAGAVATGKFLPEDDANINLTIEIETGKGILAALIDALANWTEEEQDLYVCPHPLLGMLTVREILYFTIFHAQHHCRSVIRDRELNQ